MAVAALKHAAGAMYGLARQDCPRFATQSKKEERGRRIQGRQIWAYVHVLLAVACSDSTEKSQSSRFGRPTSLHIQQRADLNGPVSGYVRGEKREKEARTRARSQERMGFLDERRGHANKRRLKVVDTTMTSCSFFRGRDSLRQEKKQYKQRYNTKLH